MEESNYSNREFEQYVKQNADQYRMFPSDKVWKGVNNALHTQRKWYGFWLGFLLLLTGGAVTWVMTTHPALKNQDTVVSKNNTGFPPSEKPVSVTESSREIENLLPFSKQSLSTESVRAETQLSNSFSPSILSIQDVVAETPMAELPANHNFPGIKAERELPTIVNKINNSNSINAPVEDNLVRNIKIADTKKLPAIVITSKQSNYSENVHYPLTIESIVNAYQFKKPRKKVSWQLFVTPTVSYRKLSVNKSFDDPSGSNYPFASLADVNSAVTHKPDMGLQIGVTGRYPITKNLKIRGGFQFNINRYDIKAYAFNGEVATIDLNAGNRTIFTWTNYRNYAGYKSDWLKNFYFSVSVPIGAELKLFGNNKTNVGIAGTLQPTYILSDRAYLISTDYKNYAEVPRLIRHINLNTGFETFVNYTGGKTKWQIGPQVRYQVFSSFHNKYPVKENLFDFGIKLGLTLNE